MYQIAPIKHDDNDNREDMKQDCSADAPARPELEILLEWQRLDTEGHPCEPRPLDYLENEEGAAENEDRAEY